MTGVQTCALPIYVTELSIELADQTVLSGKVTDDASDPMSGVTVSFGGAAAGDASIKSPGEIDRIVFLGAAPNFSAEKLKSQALFIVARDDGNDDGPRLPGIRAQYEKATQPKELIVLDGSAHAQFLFQTDQSERVMREFLRFLSMP